MESTHQSKMVTVQRGPRPVLGEACRVSGWIVRGMKIQKCIIGRKIYTNHTFNIGPQRRMLGESEVTGQMVLWVSWGAVKED